MRRGVLKLVMISIKRKILIIKKTTSYITTKNGSISQHVEYIAFGEVLFEEHSSTFSSPYLFNGKELDRETNLSYYGARYYAKTSLWLNVDPKMKKYPNYSSYNFCLNNPLKYTDPDGKDIIVISHGRRSKTSIDGGKTNAHAPSWPHGGFNRK